MSPHGKGNYQENEKKTYQMRENIGKSRWNNILWPFFLSELC